MFNPIEKLRQQFLGSEQSKLTSKIIDEVFNKAGVTCLDDRKLIMNKFKDFDPIDIPPKAYMIYNYFFNDENRIPPCGFRLSEEDKHEVFLLYNIILHNHYEGDFDSTDLEDQLERANEMLMDNYPTEYDEETGIPEDEIGAMYAMMKTCLLF